MSGRGSASSSSKRTFKPNLAAANKRATPQEQPCTSSEPRRGRNDRGRGRGGARGRGRGRGQTSTIVETQSVFSLGPSARIEPTVSSAGTFSSYGSGGGGGGTGVRGSGAGGIRDKKDGKSGVDDVDMKDVKQECIEDDVDGDNAELDELLRDDFLSSGRRGSSELPVSIVEEVKKTEDKNRRVRVIADDDEDSNSKATAASPSHIINQSTTENASLNGRYHFVTFPIKFNELVLNAAHMEAVKTSHSSGGGGNPNNSADAIDPNSTCEPHCLTGLPDDTSFGKIQVLKSGKVVLKVGHERFPIESAVDVHCKQRVMCLNTNSATAAEGEPKSGELTQLGVIGARLNVTVDAEQLVNKYNKLNRDIT